MKLSDFKFRIVKQKNKQGNYKTCDNAECKCNHPFIYGKEALLRLSEFVETEAQIELWSGLTDSEGVRIYEGDIVKSYEDGARYEIINAGDCFMAKRNGVLYMLGHLLLEEGLKVIGNIHDNAELLNCEQRG